MWPPDLIETPMTQGRLHDPQLRDQALSHIPLNRVGRPDEIARLPLFSARTMAITSPANMDYR
jgi:glucose 1-dehydrogenase